MRVESLRSLRDGEGQVHAVVDRALLAEVLLLA